MVFSQIESEISAHRRANKYNTQHRSLAFTVQHIKIRIKTFNPSCSANLAPCTSKQVTYIGNGNSKQMYFTCLNILQSLYAEMLPC